MLEKQGVGGWGAVMITIIWGENGTVHVNQFLSLMRNSR